MRTLMFPFCLFACQQVSPEGNPLEPVTIAASAPVVEPAPEAAGKTAAEKDDEAVFTLSSEDMAEALNGTPEGAAKSTDEADGVGVDAEEARGESVATPPAPAPPATDATARPGWPTQGATAWPVRLVTTVPNASPPRAILGLPDGREVVVNPGSMVPDFGIVVVAISPNSADLAKVAPAGDHATIESVTLTAQY